MNSQREAANRARREAWFRDLEKPRRYLVVSAGRFSEQHHDSPKDALSLAPLGSYARLMGTHETLSQAVRRVVR